MDEVGETWWWFLWLEVLFDGCAGSLCTVLSEELGLGDAGGVGEAASGSWIAAEKRQGRASSSASRCRKDALLISS